MGNRWYRAYEGTVSDPKLGEVAMLAECSRSVVIAAWHTILENAASLNEGGRFDATARRVAAALGEPLKVIDAVLAGLEEIGLTEKGVIVSWQRRQYESDNSTERSRKHREQKRNADATLQQQPATVVQRPHRHRHRHSTEKKDISSENEEADDFQTFYETYPRRESRGAAAKAYRSALKKTDAATILAAAKAFRAKRAGQDQKFTPLPATWLNAEKWADEPPQPIARPPSPRFDATHEDGWSERVRIFLVKGLWPSGWGPRPGEEGCNCPEHILAETRKAIAA